MKTCRTWPADIAVRTGDCPFFIKPSLASMLTLKKRYQYWLDSERIDHRISQSQGTKRLTFQLFNKFAKVRTEKCLLCHIPQVIWSIPGHINLLPKCICCDGITATGWGRFFVIGLPIECAIHRNHLSLWALDTNLHEISRQLRIHTSKFLEK